MKVLHIGTADIGGAANAAMTVHRGLAALGHASTLLVDQHRSAEEGVVALPARSLLSRLKGRALLAAGVPDWQSRRRTFGLLESPHVTASDLLVLHNLHGRYFDYRVLPRLTRLKPTVWALHDMWALTGHCAYSYDCDRWETGCHTCPQFRLPRSERKLLEPPARGFDQTRILWGSKRDVYSRSRLHVVASNAWMASLVRRSILSGAASVSVIHDGVDTETFRPLDKAVARSALGLPQEPLVLLAFPSRGRKGGDTLLQALARIQPARELVLLSVGDDPLLTRQRRFPVHHLGYVREQERLNLCLNAADLFVLPTRADNLPLSLTLAAAAGLPSVTFDVGGISEVVQHNRTGYLAKPGDLVDLVEGIELLCADDGLRERFGQASRELALQGFRAEDTVRAYEALFASLLEQA